ncbi:MAG: prepilin-type N-terminal cleavage/methylation domain-containing protein [bacterium]
MKAHGFTLIELLIVVAIIGILAAIAVPNFLGAQTRARVARVDSDMRSMAVAIETYHLDHGQFPRQAPFNTCIIALNGLPELTTPVGYLSSIPIDIFHQDEEEGQKPIKYGMCTSGATYWYLWSYGPDKSNQNAMLLYNISNGIVSLGDIKRTTAHDVLTTEPQ